MNETAVNLNQQDVLCPNGVMLMDSGQCKCVDCGLQPSICCCPLKPEITVIELEGEFDMTGGGYTAIDGWGYSRKPRVGLVCQNGVVIQDGEPRCIDCELTPDTCCCPDKPIVTFVDIGDHYLMTPDFHAGDDIAM